MTVVVAIAAVLILILLIAVEISRQTIADLRVDLLDTVRQRNDADRERRQRVDEWKGKYAQAERCTQRLLAERDFWQETAVKLGYPTRPTSAKDED
jgi:hypothetical protein